MGKIKNTLLLIIITATVVPGCKKMTVEELPEPPIVKKNNLVPIKIETKTQLIELKYLENTRLLSEIQNITTGKKEILQYSKDHVLSGLDTYENNRLVYTSDYFRDAERRIYMVTQFKVNEAVLTPLGYLTLKYNTQNQVVKITSYSTRDVMTGNQIMEYDENANLISIVKDFPLPAVKSNFSYDLKNAMFKNVQDLQLLSVQSQYLFFKSVKNNLLVGSGEKNYSFTYIYDTNNYPEQIILNEQNVKTTYKVTYQQLGD